MSNRISDACDTLTQCVDLLQETSSFNIVSFGTEFEPLFDESVLCTSENKTRARGAIENFKADMGGTIYVLSNSQEPMF